MMDNVVIKMRKIDPTAKTPVYKTEGAACMDVYANTDVTIPPGMLVVIPTGLAFEIPKGFQVKVLGRSGLSIGGLKVITGTIDSDYRGEIGIMAHNVSDTSWIITKDTRIAQLDVMKVYQAELVEVEDLAESSRGENGFGSTGVE